MVSIRKMKPRSFFFPLRLSCRRHLLLPPLLIGAAVTLLRIPEVQHHPLTQDHRSMEETHSSLGFNNYEDSGKNLALSSKFSFMRK